MEWIKLDQDKKPQVITDTWLRDWTEPEDVKDNIEVENSITSNVKFISVAKLKQEVTSNSEAAGETSTNRQPTSLNNTMKPGKKIGPEQIGHYVDIIIRKLCKDISVEKSVSNMCQYQCPECGAGLKGWTCLRNHYAKHQTDKIVSIALVAEIIKNAVSHICQVCSEKILCDNYFIKRHLRKHRLLITQYVKKFELDTIGTPPNVIYSDNIIGNFCVYKCLECGQNCTGRYALAHHIKTHSQRKRHYNEDCLEKRVYHKCKLCIKSILCDLLTITLHLKQCHNIALDQYCTKTKTEIDARNSLTSGINSSYLKSLKISNKIHNSCVFVCPLCKGSVYSLGTFKQHMVEHKPITLMPLSTYLVKSLSYKCETCSKLLLCDKFSIYYHLKLRHGLTKIDKGSVPYMKRKEYNKLCESFRRQTPISRVIKNRAVLPSNIFFSHEISSNIGNLCTFKCTKCKCTYFSSWFALRHHYKKVHLSGINFSASLVSEARYHSCLICPKVILSDRTCLKRHLTKSHKMTLMKYERIFLEKGGKVLPLYKDWLAQEA